MKTKTFLACILALSLVSCQGTAPATPAAMPTFTPTAASTLTPTIQASLTLTPTLPSALQPLTIGKISSIPFGKDRINDLVIDDQYLYWVGGKGENYMFRVSIQGGHPEKIATTSYAGGRLSLMDPILSGKWLIFADTNTFANPSAWRIRALNRETLAEKLVLNETQGTIGYFSMSADGDQVLWTQYLSEASDQDAIYLFNLASGEKREVLREKVDLEGSVWLTSAFSQGRVIIEKGFDNARGFGADIYLLDLATGSTQPLSSDKQSYSPQLVYPWAIWKSGYDTVKLVVYNMQTGQKDIIPWQEVDSTNPLMDGAHIYWTGWTSPASNAETNAIYVFDILKHTTYVLDSPGDDQMYASVAIYGNQIAWVRLTNSSSATPDSYLEWTMLQP